MPNLDGTAERLGAADSDSSSTDFGSDSGSLVTDESLFLATGDLVGAGGGEPSPVGDGLGFFPNMEDSNLTPIPRLGKHTKKRFELLKTD
jgi:hypothetical protein